MIPNLLPALERHGRLKLSVDERALVLRASAATIDRLLSDVKIATAGGRRRRAGFSSAVRRQVPVRTFNDWGSPPPGYCEVDLVAHGLGPGLAAVARALPLVGDGGRAGGGHDLPGIVSERGHGGTSVSGAFIQTLTP
jgi:hypothetical protein